MCPACATPVVVSNDEFRGEAQLAPYVPILPSRASPALRRSYQLQDEAWEQLEEADKHAGARTWTMPGDGADADAAAIIAAGLAVPSAGRGGQKMTTIGQNTKLANLANKLRLQTNDDKKKQALE